MALVFDHWKRIQSECYIPSFLIHCPCPRCPNFRKMDHLISFSGKWKKFIGKWFNFLEYFLEIEFHFLKNGFIFPEKCWHIFGICLHFPKMNSQWFAIIFWEMKPFLLKTDVHFRKIKLFSNNLSSFFRKREPFF